MLNYTIGSGSLLFAIINLMFQKYDAQVKKVLVEAKQQNWDKVLKKHQIMLARIQHERLIHLLVTIFVGLLMMVVSVAFIVTHVLSLLVFCFPLFCLFTAYILHYRYLENLTQSWYLLEDQIRARI